MQIEYTAVTEAGLDQRIHSVFDMLDAMQPYFATGYGAGVCEIAYIPVVTNEGPTGPQHPPFFEYDKRKKNLTISPKFDYATFAAADEAEAVRIAAERFYELIDEYEALGVRDFDTAAFKRDVYEFFTANGYMPAETEA